MIASRCVAFLVTLAAGTSPTSRALLVLMALALAACGPIPATTSRTTNSAQDANAVEAVLHGWYDASAQHDSAGYADALLPEFFIFEDTTRYDKATLVHLVASGFALGTDRATLSDMHTVVVGDAAWTSFRNTEAFTPVGAEPLPARRYLETAVFRRVDGRWRIERYHATRINRDNPVAAAAP